jgi:mRNA-degrading endonuclease RelE of RelBE toxin-antitoxin system
MLIIYSYEEPDDVVLIVAFQDARSSAATTP